MRASVRQVTPDRVVPFMRTMRSPSGDWFACCARRRRFSSN